LFIHEKIAVIVDQSSATAKSAHGVARTSLRRVGHPARALDWIPKRKEKSFCFFPFFLIDHPFAGGRTAAPREGAASWGGEGQRATQAMSGPSWPQVVAAPGAPGAATWLRRRTSQAHWQGLSGWRMQRDLVCELRAENVPVPLDVASGVTSPRAAAPGLQRHLAFVELGPRQPPVVNGPSVVE